MQAKDVKTKQILLVNSGDKIPVDGVVIWGEGMVNSSMMTGESELQYVATKNEVIGGTVLESGSIRIEATRVGWHTALSKIIELVRKAQNEQPDNTEQERIANFRERIAERNEKEGKNFLSFYFIEAEEYTIQ